MNFLWRLKTTRSRIAFSSKEQALTSLAIALNYLGYELTPAELKAGDPIELINFNSLLSIAQSIGFKGTYTTWKKWIFNAKVNEIVIANLAQSGTVVLQKRKNNRLLINNPLRRTLSISVDDLTCQYDDFECLILNNPAQLRKSSFDRMVGIVLMDKRFISVALILLCVSFLHGLIVLIDPIIKNVYFSNVVQLGMVDWARTLAISFVLVSVFSGILMLIGGLIGYLFSSRLSLLWSFSSFSSLLRMPDSYIRSRTRGDLLNRVRSSEALASFFGTEEVQLVAALLNSCILFIILAFTSLPMVSTYAVFLLISLAYVSTTNRGWKHRSDHLQQDKAIETGSFVQLVSAAKELQYEKRVSEAFRTHQLIIGNRIYSQQKMSLYIIYVRFGSTVIDTLQSAVLLIMAALLIMDGKIALGEYVAFSALLGQLIQPTDQLTDFVSKYQSMHAIFDRVTDIIDEARVGKLRGIASAQSSVLLGLTIKKTDSDVSNGKQEIRIPETTSCCQLVFTEQKSISDWEQYFCGDQWLPNSIQINTLFVEGKNSILYVRASPSLLIGTVQDNIEIGNKTNDPSKWPLLESLFSSTGFNQLGLDQNIESVYDVSNGLYILSIARVLYQNPRGIIIPVFDKHQHQIVETLSGSDYVSQSKVCIIVVKPQDYPPSIFETSFSMNDFENAAKVSEKQLFSATKPLS